MFVLKRRKRGRAESHVPKVYRFESLYHILNGHFSHLFGVKSVLFVLKRQKGPRMAHWFKNSLIPQTLQILHHKAFSDLLLNRSTNTRGIADTF